MMHYQYITIIVFLGIIITWQLYTKYRKPRRLPYPRSVDPLIRSMIRLLYQPMNAVKLWELKDPYYYTWVNIQDGILELSHKEKILPGRILLWKKTKSSKLVVKLRVKHVQGLIVIVESLGFSHDI